jgi:hypothetical protein
MSEGPYELDRINQQEIQPILYYAYIITTITTTLVLFSLYNNKAPS